MKIDNISRFCFLVAEINKKQSRLLKEENNFYDGGYSFEETYKTDIAELKQLKEELSLVIRNIVGENYANSVMQLFPNVPECVTNVDMFRITIDLMGHLFSDVKHVITLSILI